MKTYIIFTHICGGIGGSYIYYSNKIRYMEEHGWNVVLFHNDSGPIYVNRLQRYENNQFPFICTNPNLYTRWQRKHYIDILVEVVGHKSDKFIIESEGDYFSFWGELLAERLQCKHIVIYLGETLPRCICKNSKFFQFKHSRHELAGISKETITRLFSPYFPITIKNAIALKCSCSNSIEDIESNLLEKIPKGDLYIGHIGRLEKSGIKVIIHAIKEFSKKVNKMKISFVVFGGSRNKDLYDDLCHEFDEYSNVSIYITGYIYPLPLKVVKSMDLFISAQGSAKATACLSIPTICLSDTNEVRGIYDCERQSFIHLADKIEACIDIYLSNPGIYEVPSINISDIWNNIKHNYDEHIVFINQSCTKQEYASRWTYANINIILKFKIFLKYIFHIQ